MSELGLICLIALARPIELDPAAVLEALTQTAPISDLAVTARDPGDGASGVAVRIDARDYGAVALAGQMPDEICKMALAGGVFWPERQQVLDAHRGFLAVSAAEPAQGHGLVRAQAVALTRLAAALAQITPATGLVWPGAGTAYPAERLAKVPEQIQRGIWPVDIWVGFDFLGVADEERKLIGARSRGAAPYFGAEIEVTPLPVADPAEPMRILMNTVGQLMAHGPHLRDGQPVHVTGERPMRIALIRARDGHPAAIRLVPEEAEAG